MPPDATKGQISTPGHEHGQPHGYKLSRKVLLSFAGEHNEGVLVLDTIVRISMMTLNSYPGENELLVLFQLQGHLNSINSFRCFFNSLFKMKGLLLL